MLTFADWLIMAVLGISTLVSIWRGFVKEALSLVTWVAAILVVRFFASPFSSLLESRIETDYLRLGVACLVLFFGTMLVGGLLSYAVGEVIKVSGLAGADRFLGMFFGLVRGLLLVLAVVAGLMYSGLVDDAAWWRDSLLVQQFVQLIEQLLPDLWEQAKALLQNTDDLPEQLPKQLDKPA